MLSVCGAHEREMSQGLRKQQSEQVEGAAAGTYLRAVDSWGLGGP